MDVEEKNKNKETIGAYIYSLILGVDDDQCAIRGRGRERWCAQHFAEGLDLSCR